MGLYDRDWYREELRNKRAMESQAKRTRQESRFDRRHTGISKRALVAPAIALIAIAILFQRYGANSLRSEIQVSPDGATELAIRVDYQGHYRIQGQVNGQPVQFLVDTGATAVDIPEKLQSRLNLKALGPVRTTTASDTYTSQRTLIDTIDLGPFTLTNIEGGLNPRAQNDEILLGMSALKKFEIIQKNRTLTLRLPESAATRTSAARQSESPPDTFPTKRDDQTSAGTPQPQAAAGSQYLKKHVKRNLKECMGPHNKIDKKTLACMEGY